MECEQSTSAASFGADMTSPAGTSDESGVVIAQLATIVSVTPTVPIFVAALAAPFIAPRIENATVIDRIRRETRILIRPRSKTLTDILPCNRGAKHLSQGFSCLFLKSGFAARPGEGRTTVSILEFYGPTFGNPRSYSRP